MADDKSSKKTKRPTALKRDIRNERMSAVNKAFKSKIRTVMRRFDDSLEGAEKETIQENLKGVYSLMDKAAKRGIYKTNKVSRTKSRFAARAAKAVA